MKNGKGWIAEEQGSIDRERDEEESRRERRIGIDNRSII